LNYEPLDAGVVRCGFWCDKVPHAGKTLLVVVPPFFPSSDLITKILVGRLAPFPVGLFARLVVERSLRKDLGQVEQQHIES
jgi:hypothetical protein